MQRGAVILCGGKSTRLGGDKAMLPVGDETMLQRVVRMVIEVVPARNVVVVAAQDQHLPTIPKEAKVTTDRSPHQGPLAAMVEGLQHLETADSVFVTGCDFPLLMPAFLERMFQLLGEFDVVIPTDADRCHPLSAVYHPRVRIDAMRLLDEGNCSMHQLIQHVNSFRIATDDLRKVDEDLLSLRNVNTQEDYEMVKSLLE